VNTLVFSNDEISTEIIDITPDISLMPKLSFAGYSPAQAVGELVDNSIDAMLDNSFLKISININHNSIIIADNGCGMDKEIVSNALILAFSKKKGKLGEFGLGMKTACLSLGDCFEIATTPLCDKNLYHIQFDKKEWEKSTQGWTLPLKTKLAKEEEHFTVINIRKIKVFHPNIHNIIKKDLQKRYSPFIKSKQVEIKINGKACEPEEFIISEDTKKEFNINLNDGNRIYGWYALLREGSQKGFYGFHTYRRGRMITIYDKIGFDPHPTLARIVGEINIDHVPVTHNKREFMKETREYKEAEEVLREELKEIVKLARKKATQDTITPEVKREVDLWKDKIGDALRAEEFKGYTSSFKGPDIRQNKDSENIENMNIETRENQKNNDQDKEASLSETKELKAEQLRTPKNAQTKKKHVVKIKGKNFEFNHNFAPLGANHPWKTYLFDIEKGIEIFTNTDFPAYMATNDKSFYAVIHIAEALSEIFVQTSKEDGSDISEIKELILKKSSELKNQFNVN